MQRTLILAIALIFAGLNSATAGDQAVRLAGPEKPSEIWLELQEQIFGDVPVEDAGDMVKLTAPYRAVDASMVPIEISVTPNPGQFVTELMILVDENPAPVAAEFEMGPAMGPAIHLTTLVRVDAYSNVRVIAKLDNGKLFQTARFVKAAGGCSAPAMGDQKIAKETAGQMSFQEIGGDAPATSSAKREAQLQIKHPNNSGFQIDQVTQLFIPAFFIDSMAVMQGEEQLFRVTGGISLSHDPMIRFHYRPNGAGSVKIVASDTSGEEYVQEFPTAGS